MPLYITTLQKEAEKYANTLVSKSGSDRSKEIRYWQRYAINEFVKRVQKVYEAPEK